MIYIIIFLALADLIAALFLWFKFTNLFYQILITNSIRLITLFFMFFFLNIPFGIWYAIKDCWLFVLFVCFLTNMYLIRLKVKTEIKAVNNFKPTFRNKAILIFVLVSITLFACKFYLIDFIFGTSIMSDYEHRIATATANTQYESRFIQIIEWEPMVNLTPTQNVFHNFIVFVATVALHFYFILLGAAFILWFAGEKKKVQKMLKSAKDFLWIFILCVSFLFIFVS